MQSILVRLTAPVIRSGVNITPIQCQTILLVSLAWNFAFRNIGSAKWRRSSDDGRRVELSHHDPTNISLMMSEGGVIPSDT